MSIENIYDTAVYHPAKDEPPLFKRFPFSAELMGPYHNRSYRNKSIRKAANEVEIDSSWMIKKICKDSAVIDFAVNDLRDFLDISMEVVIAGNEKEIILDIDEKIGISESHKIEVSNKSVKITGADDPGIMRGIFFLEKLMLTREAPFLKKETYVRNTALPVRLYRSPVACYYKEAQGHYDGEHYHGNILSKIVHHGFSGIWVKAWLRDLIEPVGFEWPDRNQKKKREELRRLIKRASDCGLSVYLHMQEPQGFHKDDLFWKTHKHLKGDCFEPSHEYALCSSTPEVKEYIENGFQELFCQLPELGGVTMITASEHQAHCFSRVINPDIKITFEHWPIYEVQCPRCKKRTAQEVASEILNLAEKGIHKAKPDANVIAWNWSWSQWEEDPQRDVLKRLSDKVIVMSDFERGGKFKIFGEEFLNDEYSLTYPGPSERFKKTAMHENKKGKPVYAKLQISTTHEAGTLPHIPVMYSAAEKMHKLRKFNCMGGMFTWNFGCFTSIITELAEEFYFDPCGKNIEKIMKEIASRRYGRDAVSDVLKAWKYFSEAGKFYPRDAWSLSCQPLNHGPAYPLFFEKKEDQSPSSWLDTAMENHRVSDWVHLPWTVEKRTAAFRELLKLWEKGLKYFEEAEKKVSALKMLDFQQDFAVAKAFRNMVLCDIDVTIFASSRDEYHKSGKKSILKKMQSICKSHIERNNEMLKLIEIEPRIGYHGEGHFMTMNKEKLDKNRSRLYKLLEELDKR